MLIAVLIAKAFIVGAIAVFGLFLEIANAKELQGNGLPSVVVKSEFRTPEQADAGAISDDGDGEDVCGIDCVFCLPVCLLDPTAWGCSVCLITCGTTPV